MPLEDAKAMGAMAMFGEKYPPIVRVVELAGPWSRELCGGTHVASTGRIGMLSLLGEQSVGSGTRRVEALVSTDAFRHMAAERALVNELTGILKVQPDQLADRVSKLATDLKEAERKLGAARTVSSWVRLMTSLPGLLQPGPSTSSLPRFQVSRVATCVPLLLRSEPASRTVPPSSP